MRLIDLTMPVPQEENGHGTVATEERSIDMGLSSGTYTAVIHDYRHWSMSGTYIDLPGHIRETDDGQRADGYPLQKLFNLPAAVLRLERYDRPGKIQAQELEDACRGEIEGGALIIHALGERTYYDMTPAATVSLAADTVAWMADRGISLLLSDVYENRQAPEDIFPGLFGAGICTVCCPINLHLLTASRVKLTVLFPRFPGATQLPCRVVAVEDDGN